MDAEAQAAFSMESPKPPTEITLNVFDESTGKIVCMPIERYVSGVVQAEMPLSYHPEALKAQAIAARTYAIQKSRYFSSEGCARHPEADICTLFSCCQGYKEATSASMNAAEDTKGKILIFREHPIRAMYHACAGGHTEDAENVFVSAIAYLRGVASPGEEKYPQYTAAVTLTLTQLREAFRENDEVLLLDTLPLSDQIEILSLSASGRVTEIRVGLTAMSGNEFRRALGLKSAAFKMDFLSDAIRFTTYGSGHGVGMSQTGADAMARAGSDCEEILKWYFTGVEIGNADDYITE